MPLFCICICPFLLSVTSFKNLSYSITKEKEKIHSTVSTTITTVNNYRMPLFFLLLQLLIWCLKTFLEALTLFCLKLLHSTISLVEC